MTPWKRVNPHMQAQLSLHQNLKYRLCFSGERLVEPGVENWGEVERERRAKARPPSPSSEPDLRAPLPSKYSHGRRALARLHLHHAALSSRSAEKHSTYLIYPNAVFGRSIRSAKLAELLANLINRIFILKKQNNHSVSKYFSCKWL